MPLNGETLLPMEEAVKLLPIKLHLETFRKYARHGLNGVKLETVRLGHRLFTSKEAIGRFIVAQNGGAK